MNIKPTDLVLEIGSGNNPNPRSNILCDLFITNNSQRAGEFSIVIDRSFIVANCYKLPFKDNSFDYIICSHLLEHLEKPEKFIKELTRVGKRGYIEVPNIYGERLFGWDFHLWYCELKNKTLILTRKKEGERFGGFYHKLIAEKIWFRRFFEEYGDKFYIKYEWDNKIKIQIRKMNKMTKKYTWNLKKIYQKDKLANDLAKILVCLNCKNNLVLLKNSLFCNNCNFKYKLNRGIPIMLDKN